MKYYKVSERDLLNLLEALHELNALAYGGVDNWEWYSESKSNYIDDLCSTLGLDRDETYIEELALESLKNYEEI